MAWVEDDTGAFVQDEWPLPRSDWTLEPGRVVRIGSVASWGPFGWTTGMPPPGWRLLIDYRRAVPLPTADDDLVACLPAAVVDTAVSELALGMTEQRTMLPLLLDQAQRSRARAARSYFGSLRPVQP